MLKSALLGVTVAVVAGAALLTPKPAEAYWVRGWGWRAPVVVVAPPVFVGPRPYYRGPYYGPAGYYGPRGYWVRPHYNAYGVFIPGHWQ